jgi:superfamily I DNA and/or RNA helicase
LLDPDWPLAVCILEGVRASVENVVEANLVARVSGELRRRLLEPSAARPARAGAQADQRFWSDGLFVVSPHRAQIRAIKSALADVYHWKADPFVDTVDKMQGQQCQTVIVSYGVSDAETALSEASFIYSLNRLNVSVTRAKSKCIVFLPRPLLEPSFDLLSNEDAAMGLGHMHALVAFCRQNGEERTFDLSGAKGLTGSLVAIRARHGRAAA